MTPEEFELHCRLSSYNTAVELLKFEATLVWYKLTALVIAASILAGTIVTPLFARTGPPGHPWWVIFAGILGISTTGAWIVLINRGVKTYRYWLFKARQEEERLTGMLERLPESPHSDETTSPRSPVDILTVGEALAKNATANVPLSSRTEAIRFNRVERLAKGKTIEGVILPLVFLLYFVVALGYGVVSLTQGASKTIPAQAFHSADSTGVHKTP